MKKAQDWRAPRGCMEVSAAMAPGFRGHNPGMDPGAHPARESNSPKPITG